MENVSSSVDTFLAMLERHSGALAMLGSCVVTLTAGVWALYRYIDDRKQRRLVSDSTPGSAPVREYGPQDVVPRARSSLAAGLVMGLQAIPGAAIGFVMSPIIICGFLREFILVLALVALVFWTGHRETVLNVALFIWWLGSPVSTAAMALGTASDKKPGSLTTNMIGLGYGSLAGMAGQMAIAGFIPLSLIAHFPMPGGLPLIGAAAGAVGGSLATMK